ncbi:MAG TPA: AMP-binding protein, partial [Polyangiaceae bacterium]|nr:AMP-binding protein [Polyangiaceae bacterium]
MNKDVVPWPSDLAARYRAGGLWRGQTVGAWFTERAALFADRTAVVEGARRVTYRMLAASAARLACSFSGLGLRPGDRVVVQLPNGVELVEVLLALFGSGLVPVLALPAHRQIELEAFCSGTGATALIVSARQGATDLLPMAARIRRSCAATVRHLVVHGHSGPLDPDVQPLEALYDASDEVALGILGVASEMALLQLSGGSTGIPKLVPRTHDDYLYSVRASAELCRLTPETRYLAALPMTHNFTLSSPGVLGVLHAGGCVVACSHPIPDVALRLLVSERITITSAVPSLARAWMDAKARCLGECALTGLLLQIGGARLDEGLARDLLRVMGC